MALIPAHYLNSVVSIQITVPDGIGGIKMSPIATGFLIGNPTGAFNAEGQALYRVYLVTNRHVFQNLRTRENLKEVFF